MTVGIPGVIGDLWIYSSVFGSTVCRLMTVGIPGVIGDLWIYSSVFGSTVSPYDSGYTRCDRRPVDL